MATVDSLPPVIASTEPMESEAPPADETKPATKKKAVKVTKPKKDAKTPKEKSAPKAKSSSTHPSYEEMVKDAIVSLKERSGSSQYAIQKFLEEKHKALPPTFRKRLLMYLKKMVASDKLVKVKGSFKLPSARVSAPKSAAVVVKPKEKVKAAVVKPKAAKVKAKVVPKTKSVAKPAKAGKVVTKAKPAATVTKAKAKVVAKAKPAATKTKVVAEKPKLKERASKVARTSTTTSPGRKAPKARTAPKKVQAKKSVSKTLKSPVKKSPVAKKVAAKRGKK